jgi:hypothetical protein
MSRVIRTPSPAAAAHAVLCGHPILRVEPHRRDPGRGIFVFGEGADAAVEEFFKVFNAMTRKASRELQGRTPINHSQGKEHDHGIDQEQPK